MGELETIVPEVMQNVSLNLIAWQQAQNAIPSTNTSHASNFTSPLHNASSILESASGSETMGATQDTTCSVSRLRYTYERTRLLAARWACGLWV